MRSSRFSEEQIIGILLEQEARLKTAEVWGTASTTFRSGDGRRHSNNHEFL